jgi:HEAT repeat protein
MKNLMLAGAACTALLATDAFAHGGVYRGPGDTVPPVTGGGPRTGAPGAPGPVTPGPTAPGAPTPGGPVTPGPAAPGAVTGGPPAPGGRPGPRTGGPGIVLSADLSKWQFWWEFNKDPFINLKDAIHAPAPVTGSSEFYLGYRRGMHSRDSAKPSESDVQDTILPTLKRALENSDNRDIQSSCIIALAKIGRDSARFKILPIFADVLKNRDQEVRETAALAMGISAMPVAIDALIDLATDSAAGRKLVARSQVGTRTRSFACYGIGLVANRNNDVDLKTRAFQVLSGILLDQDHNERNIKVAAINSLALLKLKTENADAKEQKLLADTLATLDAYYTRKMGRGSDLIKSHIPPAIAKLIGRGDTNLHRKYKSEFVGQLTSRKKQSNDIYRATALALGQLVLPGEDAKDDAAYSKALYKFFENGKDAQARYFSLLALGQIGGNTNRTTLLKVLTKGTKALERPWAAIALGVMNFQTFETDPHATVDDTIGRALSGQLKSVGNPEARAAFAVALGLSRYTTAASELQAMLQKYRSQDELAGYICLSLALMNHQGSKNQIHDVVRGSVRRPELLKQAAVALGKLGDKRVTHTLIGMLQEKESNLAKLSAIASALSFIGDRRTIAPLKKMLHDDNLTPLSRAFAAVALGGVADKEKLPWNSKIARNMNYRGSVETLTQSGTGVLEIL